MNKVIRIDYDKEQITDTYSTMMVYITCHTDGEPKDLFWVWEVDRNDLADYFRDGTGFILPRNVKRTQRRDRRQ